MATLNSVTEKSLYLSNGRDSINVFSLMMDARKEDSTVNTLHIKENLESVNKFQKRKSKKNVFCKNMKKEIIENDISSKKNFGENTAPKLLSTETNTINDNNPDDIKTVRYCTRNTKKKSKNFETSDVVDFNIMIKENDVAYVPLKIAKNINMCSYCDKVNKNNLKNVDNDIKTDERKKTKKSYQIKANDDDKRTIIFDTSNKQNRKEGSKPKWSLNDCSCNTEQIILESSEDEQIIKLTKKKNKSLLKKNKTLNKELVPINGNNDFHQAESNLNFKKKESIKIAPIFVNNKSVSTAIKKEICDRNIPYNYLNSLEVSTKKFQNVNSFPTVVHVQQFKHTLKTNFNRTKWIDDHIPKTSTKLLNDVCYKNLLSFKTSTVSKPCLWNNKQSLKSLKIIYPKFPVYRTYKYLKMKISSKLNDIKLNDITNEGNFNWTSKYKATSSSEIIGNFESITEIKKWLSVWTDKSSQNNVTVESDSSDFCYSDVDSNDSLCIKNNFLILNGPVGSGKTSCIYAIASELAIKVIEVNASSKRSGKIMLQELQEATQSHKVVRINADIKKNNANIDITEKNKHRKRKIKTKTSTHKLVKTNDNIIKPINSQEPAETDISLILIDDADIIFEQDDGFCSAVRQLIECSKRPVILVTSSLSCPHLKRFLQCAKVVTMNSFLPRMLGMWLDILCLVDRKKCIFGSGAKFLEYFKGDIRKTMNYLEFFVSDESPVTSEIDCESHINIVKKDINLLTEENMYGNEKTTNANVTENLHTAALGTCYMNTFHWMNYEYPFKISNVWWSIPQLFYNNTYCSKEAIYEDSNETSQSENGLYEMEAIDKVLDDISNAEYISSVACDDNSFLVSPPWNLQELDSVSDQENFIAYNRVFEDCHELSHSLILDSVNMTQRHSKRDLDESFCFPSMAQKRQRDSLIKCHHDLLNGQNAANFLDKKALALDYWPAFRSICRIEKSNTNINRKRHNRFFHYLNSLKINTRGDCFELLASSLYIDENKKL